MCQGLDHNLVPLLGKDGEPIERGGPNCAARHTELGTGNDVAFMEMHKP